MPLTEITRDPVTGRRRFRGLVTDGAHRPTKNQTVVVRVQLPQISPAPAPALARVRDSLDIEGPKPKLTGPAEAFWPTEGYSLGPDGDDIVVRECTPSGEEREIKRYSAARFGFERVDKNWVVRRREQSMADRMARGEVLRQQRLRDQARLEEMNRRNAETWGRK